MNKDGLFVFDGPVMEAIFCAYKLIHKLNCPILLKEILFVPMYSMEISPLYRYLRDCGLSDEMINERRNEILFGYEGLRFNRTVAPVAFLKKTDDTEKSTDEQADEQYVIAAATGEGDNEALICPGLMRIPKKDAINLMRDGITVYNIDYDIIRLFETADKIATNIYGKSTIGVSELIAAYAGADPDIYNHVMEVMLPDLYQKVEIQSQDDDAEVGTLTMPAELASFVRVMNKEEPEDCPIVGREKELKKLFAVLMRQKKANAVLVGEPGVGKTAIVEKFVWMVQNGKCPERLRDTVVLSLDITAIVAGTQLRGSAESRFLLLKEFLVEHPNCILFVDEIHLILGAGACRAGELDLANSLKPILASGETRVIGATTLREYETYFSRDGALRRRFEMIPVKAPRSSEVAEILTEQVKSLERFHGVTISREMIEAIILEASCFDYGTSNPDRSFGLLDTVMSTTEIEGRTVVTREDVLSNYQIYRKKFDKMGYELKHATTVHESGHYILFKESPELVEYETLAVSAYPAKGYLGVTVCDILEDETPSESYNYFVQMIGSLLGGAIAEEKYANMVTAGAISDIERANDIAKAIVTKLSLDKDSPDFRVYNYPETIGDTRKELDSRIDKVLQDGRKYAEKLLEDNMDKVLALAEALEKNGILTELEIQNLFKERGLSS